MLISCRRCTDVILCASAFIHEQYNTLNTIIKLSVGTQGLYDFTHQVQDIVGASDVVEGLVTLFIRHTSASLLLQENADPAAGSTGWYPNATRSIPILRKAPMTCRRISSLRSQRLRCLFP